MTLLICRTCPRYDNRSTGDFGRALDDQIAKDPSTTVTSVRHVQCLGGCPDDGVAAVDGPGKARVRFTGLTPAHAGALLRAAHAHEACQSGAPDDWDIPSELRDRISSVTYKRWPSTPGGRAGWG